MKVLYKKLSENAKEPSYGTTGSAAADMYALLEGELTISPKETVLVHTGIAMEIPEGYVGLVCARSGLATKRGLAPANKVGVIDSDYRGEIMVALHNHSSVPQTIAPYERVAQLMIVPYLFADFDEVDNLDDTDRGAGGFGSTGRK
ncbi:MAG: dUTP diphosphatase [Ruminococcaceae bacterium]|nr:dUTP diphosphatase [Oscillospiraceae bacterium]